MSEAKEIIIWDPIVRIFHWSLAASFLINFFITEDGDTIHNWVGYVAMFLIAIRIIWGFIAFGFKGSKNALFKNFWPTKQKVHEHFLEIQFGKLDPNEGHNPAGALMIFTLMGLISLLGFTGYLMENVDFFWGSDFMEDFHELLANITMLAVVLHVSSVLVIQKWTGTQLVKPMWKGKREIK